MTDFQPKLGDRAALSNFELEVLDTKVLPKARQWMLDYPDEETLRQRFIEQGILSRSQID